MELKRISKAIDKGIVMFPVLGCDNVHSYPENMPYNTLKQIPIMIQNLGVEEKPKLRKVPFMKPSRRESKESLIVRIVEVYTPKDLALPVSIQELKDKIEQRKNAVIAEVAKYGREQANLQLDTVPEDKRHKVSNKRMRDVKHFIACFSPDAKKRHTITNTPQTPMNPQNIHVFSPVIGKETIFD